MEPETTIPKRGSGPLVLLAVLVVAASGIGALLYNRSQSQARRGFIDATGFDLSQTQAPAHENAGGLPAKAPAQGQSSLGMVTGAPADMQFGAKGGSPQTPKQAAAQDFAQSVRASEASMRALAEDYTRRYPVIQQYGRDWMSYPELKQLNDDYFRDHDPVKFLRGLAASPNFPKLVKKYATSPEIQAFAKDAITRAPGKLLSGGLEVVEQDGTIKKIAENVMSALGLPAGLLAAASGGKVDQNAVMSSMLNNNPELQKALNQSQGH